MDNNTTLDALIKAKLGVDSHPNSNPVTSSVALTATRITQNNPNRIALFIQNIGGTQIFIGRGNNVSISYGILLDANGGAVDFNWEYDFTRVSAEWWAISIGGVGTVQVDEVVTV